MSGALLDSLAYSSPFRTLPPAGKFLLALALLLASLFSRSVAAPALILLLGLAALGISTRLRIPKLLVYAYLNTLLIVLVSAAIVSFLVPGDRPAAFLPSYGGLLLGARLLLRSLAGFSVLLAFASSTPIPQLSFMFREIRLPAFVAEMTLLIYRYSLMMLEQLGQMWLAAECRLGFRGLRNSLRTTGRISAGLLSRSLDFAERAEQALYSRNFRGEFPTYREPARTGAAWLALSAAALSAILLFDFLFFRAAGI